MKHIYHPSPKIASFGFVFFIVLAFGYSASAQTRDYSIDLADVLSIADEAKLDEMARKLEERTNVQFLFYTIDNLGDRTIEEVSLEAAQKLGVGAKGLNSGLVLLFSIKDRKMRLEVGYGMEWHIPDAKAAKLIEALIPFLQKNDYYNAFVKGFSEVKTLLGKDNWFLDNRRFSVIVE
ncbi:MAG: TPM domain-containing protein [Microscillaceae bacterium]|nr:TPM domain-containing protein [Microscillaceae bacterium]